MALDPCVCRLPCMSAVCSVCLPSAVYVCRLQCVSAVCLCVSAVYSVCLPSAYVCLPSALCVCRLPLHACVCSLCLPCVSAICLCMSAVCSVCLPSAYVCLPSAMRVCGLPLYVCRLPSGIEANHFLDMLLNFLLFALINYSFKDTYNMYIRVLVVLNLRKGQNDTQLSIPLNCFMIRYDSK